MKHTVLSDHREHIEVELSPSQAANSRPSARKMAASGNPSNSHEYNKRQRRTGRFLAILLFLFVVGCAIAFPVIFVLNKDDDGSPSLVGDEEGVDVVVTFEPAGETMTDAQTDALETATFKFYTVNLAGLRLSGVSVISQLLVAARDSSQRQRALQQTNMALRTTLRVVPEKSNATLTSQQLASIVDKDGAELLSLLKRESTDEYFGNLDTVYATAIVDPLIEPTQPGNDSDDGTCNGLANLCDIPVNDVLFATMHNANADRSISPLLPNHDKDLMAGLNAGIRGLNMDMGFCSTGNGTALSLMHGTCIIGFSDARQVLTNIHNWLTTNPTQVILMPIQIANENTVQSVRINEHVAPLLESIVDSTGRTMADRLYAHAGPGSPWPTLGELIESDERILFFFYNSDETCSSIECPRGFHDWFAYAAESEFVFSSVEEIQQDTARACGITRGGSGTRDFYGVNMFLEIPSRDAAAVLNGADVLPSHLDACSEETGLLPNLVLVDFWDQGDLIEVVQDWNSQLQPSDAQVNNSSSAFKVISSEVPSPSPSVALIAETPVQQIVATLSPSVNPSTRKADTGRACNGFSNLCNVPVNATLFATMHNANADRQSNFLLPNHDLNLLAGLQAGIRGLSIDIGLCQVDGVTKLSLVHGVCFVGIGDPFQVFVGINNFLQQNPNEVIIIPTQIADNTGGTVQLTEIFNVMEQVVDDSGVSMTNRLYAHPGASSPWPTLGELIDLDKRILFFIYNGEQTCQSGCPVGFHDWFAYAMETRFEFSDAATIVNDPEDACVVTRGGESSTRSFFGVNVFTRVASSEAAAELNDAAFLQQHIETCSTLNGGKDPNLILVDFWNIGDVIQVAQDYNSQVGIV